MQNFSEVFQWIDEHESDFVNQLLTLLKIDTTNPPGSGYEEFVNYLEQKLLDSGLQTERVIVPDELIHFPMTGPRINLVARYNNGKKPLGVYAHMDTVPIRGNWTRNPWGEVSDGRIWGRGASDLKSSVAAYLAAMQVIHTLKLPVEYDVVGLMCTDEEVSHENTGILYLAKKGYVPHELLCLESGQDPFLVEGFVGVMTLEVIVHGKACHSGKSYEGVNALEGMIPILEELLKLKSEVENRKSKFHVEPSFRSPSKFRTPRLNLNVINSDGKHNMIPGMCHLIADRRYIPEENAEEVEIELREAVNRGKHRSVSTNVEVTVKRGYPPMTIDINRPLAQKMKHVLKLVQGYSEKDFHRFISFGSSDMALLQQLIGIDQMAIFGAGRDKESNFHAPDENIRISDFIALIKELVIFFTTP